MLSIQYSTPERTIDIRFQGQSLKVIEKDQTIAEFDILSVWDCMKQWLAEQKINKLNPGLERRKLEAQIACQAANPIAYALQRRSGLENKQ